MNCQAIEFTLDCQELANKNLLTKSSLDELINRYNACIDCGKLVFHDGSETKWSHEESSWLIIKNND